MQAAASALDTLLRVRQHRRDGCRLTLVELELRAAALKSQQDAITREREADLAELRSREPNRTLDVAALSARRQHLESLSRGVKALERQRDELARQIAEQTERLVCCDREVQSLEKLLESRTVDAIASRQRWEARELDDVCCSLAQSTGAR